MRTAWQVDLEQVWSPFVHMSCAHNEVRALLMRTLGPTPEPVEGARPGLRRSFARISRLCSRYSGERWDYLRTAESYGGRLRKRYVEAERSLREDGPLSSSDHYLRAFLKAEKCKYDKLSKPRMIFPRSPRYNLALASWLKPFEHWLWGNLKSVGTRHVPKRRVVGKGLNGPQRARLIRDKFLSVEDCVVFEVDGKAFEAHTDLWQLQQEQSCYARAFSGDPELMRILSKQLVLKGATSNGVKFRREGARASGDYNTGMGNTIVMLALVDCVLSATGCPQFDTLVDGDNALIFIPRSWSSHVVGEFPKLALLHGHEMTLEKPVDYLEGIRFGQSAPVETSSGWTMVRDWKKVLSYGTSSHANLNEPRFAATYLRGVGSCEAFLAREVPILWRWAEILIANTSARGLERVDISDYSYLGVPRSVLDGVEIVRPTVVSRSSFARAFGVSPAEQVELEGRLSWSGGFSLAVPQPVPSDKFYLEPRLCA